MHAVLLKKPEIIINKSKSNDLQRFYDARDNSLIVIMYAKTGIFWILSKQSQTMTPRYFDQYVFHQEQLRRINAIIENGKRRIEYETSKWSEYDFNQM